MLHTHSVHETGRGARKIPERRGNECLLQLSAPGEGRQAAPAIYRATRPHISHRSVTWLRGGGGIRAGSRSNCADAQDGQTSGIPVRSLAIRFSACAGLYDAGRGLRMYPPNCGPFGRSSANANGLLQNSNHRRKGQKGTFKCADRSLATRVGNSHHSTTGRTRYGLDSRLLCVYAVCWDTGVMLPR